MDSNIPNSASAEPLPTVGQDGETKRLPEQGTPGRENLRQASRLTRVDLDLSRAISSWAAPLSCLKQRLRRLSA